MDKVFYFLGHNGYLGKTLKEILKKNMQTIVEENNKNSWLNPEQIPENAIVLIFNAPKRINNIKKFKKDYEKIYKYIRKLRDRDDLKIIFANSKQLDFKPLTKSQKIYKLENQKIYNIKYKKDQDNLYNLKIPYIYDKDLALNYLNTFVYKIYNNKYKKIINSNGYINILLKSIWAGIAFQKIKKLVFENVWDEEYSGRTVTIKTFIKIIKNL